MARWVGLGLGPAAMVACLLLPAPEGLPPAGWRTAAVAVLMAIWWVTEAIPIAATALVPLLLLPVFGISDARTAAVPYGSDMVFLSLGGFFLALAMERWGLHRRVALGIVAAVGTSPRRIVLGFMLGSAFLSMWISNTATTAMMLPIALAVAALFRPEEPGAPFPLGTCLMLGVAYAATMGGVATLIGTPPNLVLAGQAETLLGVEIGFVDWMLVGLPIAMVFVPTGWLLLTYWLFPPADSHGDARSVIDAQRRGLGRMGRGEKIVATVFVVTALAWILRSPKTLSPTLTLPGLQTWLPHINDSTISIAAAIALFVIPVDPRRGTFVLDWDTAKRIPWGVILLFGGGFSLAEAMKDSGLATWIGSGVAELGALPTWLAILVIAAVFVFLTEITSNVATATMAMPIMAGAAAGLGMPPLALMATAALSASMAFMLPVATPPNAIVFGSGYVSMRQMVKAGIWLNLCAVIIVTIAAQWLVPRLL